MRDLKLITEMLRHYPWSKEAVADGFIPVFTEMGIDSHERAKILVQDMQMIGCDWPIRAIPVNEHMILSHYEIPNTDFGKMDEDGVPEVMKAHGSGLNWGSIIRLSKACEVGRHHLSVGWPTSFKEQLLNPKDHLSFIEEMLWLNLWHGISDIEYEAQPFLSEGCSKHVDWRFQSCGQTINLEIKYRPKEWMRKVDGPKFNIVMPGYYYDVPPKFPTKYPGELNIVGVSTPAPIDRSLQEQTELLLRKNQSIDGVVIWSQSSEGDSPFEIHSLSSHSLINTFFTGGDLEEKAHIGLIRYVWRDRDKRRAHRDDEVPALLQNLSKSLSEGY